MKRIIVAMAVTAFIASCNESGNSNTTNDSAGQTNPTAIDTTQHPNGMTNGSVISTDTASMNVNNVNPAGRDSANKH
jgi:hypothetical protein